LAENHPLPHIRASTPLLNEPGHSDVPGLSSIHIFPTLDNVSPDIAGFAPSGRRNHAGQGIMHAAQRLRWRRDIKDTLMKNGAKVAVIVLGILPGIFTIGFSHPSSAQTAIGGPTKPKQSTLGGAATPAPVIGGATKQGPVVGTAKLTSVGGPPKQGSVGGTATPGSTGSATTSTSTGGIAKQNPPVGPPNKGGPVVTSNLKCAAGACVAKGKKP
jgi:hypothetical protein